MVNVLRKSETIEIFAEMPILAAGNEKDIFKISVLLKSVKNLSNLRLTQGISTCVTLLEFLAAVVAQR